MSSHRIAIGVLFFLTVRVAAQDREAEILSQHSYDLAGPGRAFLLNEARRVDFFMLGELHGEKEIPELLASIWPEMYQNGYHHIAAEVSPWAASKLEFPRGRDSLKIEGLWTNREAQMVRSVAAKQRSSVLWGCDMEELAVGEMLKEFFQDHPSDKNSAQVLKVISGGYNRKQSPELLAVFNNVSSYKRPGDELFESILVSLKIDSARAFPESRLRARLLREDLMKRSFVKNYGSDPKFKVLLRFGRNHLHYGFDDRGISTLGNFISEFSTSKNLKCFNVAVFAAGGKYAILDNVIDADERGEDIAFQFFSERANHNATVFDLRPLRTHLHTIASNKRSDLQRRLLYWVNSYDTIICYRTVSPR